MALWTSSDAQAATGGQSTREWTAGGVSIDTRTLQAGDLFVALKSARDGHDFVAQALENGAAAALVDHRPDGVPDDAPLLIVPDVLQGLEQLAIAARARMQGRVIAVTGSVGKTSTKEMLRDMLAQQGRTHASVASYNNHWGVPLTLARMPADTEFAVIEIGMNHPGEISPLTKLARPHVAMVTTVGPAHLEAFGSVEKIALEKASIIDGLMLDGVAVFNGDIETAPVLAEYAAQSGVAVKWFGEQAPDAQAVRIRVGSDVTKLDAFVLGQSLSAVVQSAGRHFALNALGAILAIDQAGGDIHRAAQDLAHWTPVTGRGARETIALPKGQFFIIDDAYNSNPASLRASLSVLSSAVQGKRRIAILGDMKELGPDEQALHRDIATWDEIDNVDVIHTLGPLMQSLHDVLPTRIRGEHFETLEAAVTSLPAEIQPQDVVLLKASLSMGMGQVVDALRHLRHSADKD